MMVAIIRYIGLVFMALSILMIFIMHHYVIFNLAVAVIIVFNFIFGATLLLIFELCLEKEQ